MEGLGPVPDARGARKAGARSLWKGRYGRWTRRSKRLAGSLARSTSWWRLQMLVGKHSGGSRLIWRLRPYFAGAGNSRALFPWQRPVAASPLTRTPGADALMATNRGRATTKRAAP